MYCTSIFHFYYEIKNLLKRSLMKNKKWPTSELIPSKSSLLPPDSPAPKKNKNIKCLSCQISLAGKQETRGGLFLFEKQNGSVYMETFASISRFFFFYFFLKFFLSISNYLRIWNWCHWYLKNCKQTIVLFLFVLKTYRRARFPLCFQVRYKGSFKRP